MVRIYIASKMTHAEKWRSLYSDHPFLHVVSRWPFLEPFVHLNSDNAKKFWQDDVNDIKNADDVIVYAEEGEHLRGALVEAGIAIGLGKYVVVIGKHADYGSWRFHPQVINAKSIPDAYLILESILNG